MRPKEIYNYYLSPPIRQGFYLLAGGSRDYVDVGFKAFSCVDFDRRCADIMKQRLQRELKEMEL